MSLFKAELVSVMRGFCHTSLILYDHGAIQIYLLNLLIRLPIVIGVQLSHMNIREGSSVLKFSDDRIASELSFIMLCVLCSDEPYG